MKSIVCVSDRCFFPLGTLISARKIGQMALSLGYDGVEYHPTWRIWWEMKRFRRLSCANDLISSFHASWRDDGLGSGYTWLKRKFLVPEYQLFPPQAEAWQTLRQLEALYQKPVVCHWPEALTLWQRPLLELHQLLPLKLNRLRSLYQAKKIYGLVLDTKKFSGWLAVNHPDRDGYIVLKALQPLIAELHVRFSYGAVNKKLLCQLHSLGWQGRIVIEGGWPEGKLTGQDHRQTLSLIKKLMNN